MQLAGNWIYHRAKILRDEHFPSPSQWVFLSVKRGNIKVGWVLWEFFFSWRRRKTPNPKSKLRNIPWVYKCAFRYRQCNTLNALLEKRNRISSKEGWRRGWKERKWKWTRWLAAMADPVRRFGWWWMYSWLPKILLIHELRVKDTKVIPGSMLFHLHLIVSQMMPSSWRCVFPISIRSITSTLSPNPLYCISFWESSLKTNGNDLWKEVAELFSSNHDDQMYQTPWFYFDTDRHDVHNWYCMDPQDGILCSLLSQALVLDEYFNTKTWCYHTCFYSTFRTNSCQQWRE